MPCAVCSSEHEPGLGCPHLAEIPDGPLGVPGQRWYSVRIDRDFEHPGKFKFQVEVFESKGDKGLEMLAIDSVPGIIAILLAESPGHACLRAWQKAEESAREHGSVERMLMRLAG